MSKINQIQNALIELEGGIFQKLCDAYLKAKGFDAINSLGSVIGANKTKTGTPDTYIRQQDGQLIFVEYTTTQTNVIQKFTDDLTKCLNEEKTGVAKSEISQIIFCHNSSLDIGKENKLVRLAKENGTIATVYGLEPISFDLYIEYPGLARDFLDIEIDTGQVLSPDDFINSYDKNQLTTPLSTEFQLRGDEVKHALEHLTSNDLLILSGPAGVGKSRLALEIICQYQAQHTDTQAFCIMHKGQDLFEDIKVYFSKNGSFIILVVNCHAKLPHLGGNLHLKLPHLIC